MAKHKTPGKWISGLSADTPLIDAARQVLTLRLEAAATLLPLAAFSTKRSEDLVHQLRIATRRAAAALDVFAPCVRPRRLAKMKRRLRRIRRAAGLARQCDVHRQLFDDLRQGEPDATSAALDHLVGWLDDRRIEAQREVAAVAQRSSPRKFRRAVQRLLDGLHDPSPYAVPMTLHDAAAAVLPSLTAALREAAQQDLTDLDQLHELRIRVKRLRYAMEVLWPCLGPDFHEALYRHVEQLQDHLGPINDAHEVVILLQGHVPGLEAQRLGSDDAAAVGSGLAKLIETFTQRRETLRAHFERWWMEVERQGLLEAIESAARPTPARPTAAQSLQDKPEPEIVTRPITLAPIDGEARDGASAATGDSR